MPHPDFPDDATYHAHPPTVFTKKGNEIQRVRSHNRLYALELRDGPGPWFLIYFARTLPTAPDEPLHRTEAPNILVAKHAIENRPIWAGIKHLPQLNLALRAAIENRKGHPWPSSNQEEASPESAAASEETPSPLTPTETTVEPGSAP